MRDTINYYYNLNPNRINKIFDYYYFYLDNELYYFVVVKRDIKDMEAIYEFNKRMIYSNISVNEIINNKSGNIITYVNKLPYVLIRVVVNINKPIRLDEISYLSGINISYRDNLMRSNWAMLWANKIDYLEYHHEQNYKKFPILNDSFDYFVGMAENAISYLNSTLNGISPERSDIGVISHDIIRYDDTVYSLYDPLNIIIDHKARDLGEYIKNSFFNDNFNIFEELNEYFKYNYFSLYGINLVIARILYPSFYFDRYDAVVSGKASESSILSITSRIHDYEAYIRDIFNYFHKFYNIRDIAWIKNR